jgi:hypothetical protein
MTAGLLDQFLEEECTPHVVQRLREAARVESGERYFTFNRFNVRLDLDAGIATVEDELNPEFEVDLPIDELVQLVTARTG